MMLLRTFATSSLIASTLLSSAAMAQSLTREEALRLVTPFYELLNQPGSKDVKTLGERAIAPDWRSYGNEKDYKGREEFIKQVTGFGRLIPDLRWDIKEVLVDGNRIIVRSQASGTPVGPFFGVTPNGKGFNVMAIDIHTVKDGQLVVAHHVEDWAGAIRQVGQK